MDGDPTDYKKLAVKSFPARAIRETTEGKYWGKFKDPVDIQQVTLLPPHRCFTNAPYHVPHC
jgi:hypothetical protein